MEVNPDKNTVEPQLQLAVSIDSLVATPAAKPDPNIIPCTLLHCIHMDAQPLYRGHISCTIDALSNHIAKELNFNVTEY